MESRQKKPPIFLVIGIFDPSQRKGPVNQIVRRLAATSFQFS